MRRRNGACTTQSPAFRGASPCTFGALSGADHTHSNACFPAEVEWKVAGSATQTAPARLSVNGRPRGLAMGRQYPHRPALRNFNYLMQIGNFQIIDGCIKRSLGFESRYPRYNVLILQ